jgi:hypothetical protein
LISEFLEIPPLFWVLFGIGAVVVLGLNHGSHWTTRRALRERTAMIVHDVPFFATHWSGASFGRWLKPMQVAIIDGAIVTTRVSRITRLGKPYLQINRATDPPDKLPGVWATASVESIEERGDALLVRYRKHGTTFSLRLLDLDVRTRRAVIDALV